MRFSFCRFAFRSATPGIDGLAVGEPRQPGSSISSPSSSEHRGDSARETRDGEETEEMSMAVQTTFTVSTGIQMKSGPKTRGNKMGRLLIYPFACMVALLAAA